GTIAAVVMVRFGRFRGANGFAFMITAPLVMPDVITGLSLLLLSYYFASVVKNYPRSPKAADAMYKVGVIMQDKGDTAKAKAVYQ
ncbi:hypothetical protein MJN51_34680, partial [Salmonella enterica subsp. enterica serovar Kentucky]|nr:hypothetical protein [Salmonella enterica subsp. enterica serovar Kentucky]